MTDSLSVDVDGVHGLGDIHSGVSAGLGSLGAAPPGSVGASHGTIAAAVDTALAGTLGSRSGAITDTQAAGSLISELLHQSAIAYERGDQAGGDAIRAAADQISHGEVPAESAGSSGGADALGQAVGQLGQLAQMGQLLGAPLAALAQPLTQLPQALMQGLAQMPQIASSAGESVTAEVPETDVERPAPEEDSEREPEEPADEAEAGPETAADPEPVPMPPPAPDRPAPVRPSFD